MNLFLLFLGWPFAAIDYPAEIRLVYLTGKSNLVILVAELKDPALQFDVKGPYFQHFIVVMPSYRQYRVSGIFVNS